MGPWTILKAAAAPVPASQQYKQMLSYHYYQCHGLSIVSQSLWIDILVHNVYIARGATVWFVCTGHSQCHCHGHCLCLVIAGKIIHLSCRQDSKYYSEQLSLTESVLSLVLSIYIQQVLPNYHWHHYVDSHHKIFWISLTHGVPKRMY